MKINIHHSPETVSEGTVVTLTTEPPADSCTYRYDWELAERALVLTEPEEDRYGKEVHWDTSGSPPGAYTIRVKATLDPPGQQVRPQKAKEGNGEVTVNVHPRPLAKGDVIPVTMRRTATPITTDVSLWVVIRKSTEAMSFTNYSKFIDVVLCGKDVEDLAFSDYERAKVDQKIDKLTSSLRSKRFLPFTDTDAYRFLKVATEAFVAVNCGVVLDKFPFDANDLNDVNSSLSVADSDFNLEALWKQYLVFVNGSDNVTIPYFELIRNKLKDVGLKDRLFKEAELPEDCIGIVRDKLTNPCLIELIWSYWHEEGMLVQTLNTISRRFQNIRISRGDALANLEIDPLRPLNNILWGYIQDEQHRLGVVRRAYEYSHHYGLTLKGKAVSKLQPADNRSRFIEAFHNLLHLCWNFYQQDDDTTVHADGFPLLNALKEVHLLLTQGMHNQFGDMPSTARMEMLMQQWLLARPEMREFLSARRMVAYPEPWMDGVDAMKKVLKTWSGDSVIHFRNLAVFGEQLLLSCRFGAWNSINDKAHAENWARYWRSEIQGYSHAYRAVTGVDLTSDRVDVTPPSILLQRRLSQKAALGL
jgi:hypothetical protein